MYNQSRKLPLRYNPEFEKEIGSLIISGFHGAKITAEMKTIISDGLGGVILFPGNLDKPKKILKLTTALAEIAGDRGFIVSIDHEGGRVMRAGEPFTRFPPFAAIGATGDVELARRVGEAQGLELAAVGVNMNYSPVVDLAEADNSHVIGDRSFGTDPERVVLMATAYIDGLQAQGVAACAKHFPGHGAVAGDSHCESPKTDMTAEQLEPHMSVFRKMSETGVASIMTAHIIAGAIDPYYPSTLSSSAIKGILRESMGYEGVIITDDLEMAAIASIMDPRDGAFMAVRSGADMVLVARDTALAVAIRKHIDVASRHMAIPFEDLTASFERVSRLKRDYPCPRKDRPPLDVIGCTEHRDLAKRITSYG